MALKDDSATIDAITKLLLTEMWRLDDRIEVRCAGIEHSIGPVLTTSASATTDDEPACAAGRLSDEELIFLDGPVFDEEPIFFEEGPIFDKEPGFDEESVFGTKPVFDEESVTDEGLVYNAAPSYDEDPGDFSTAGCGMTLFDDLDVGTAMVGHNTTASPRQASMTSNINKEFVLNSFRVAEALATMVVVPSNVNADAPITCSTKCLSVVDMCTVTEVVLLGPICDAAAATTISNVPKNIISGRLTRCSMIGLDVGSGSLGVTAVFQFGVGMFKDVLAPADALGMPLPTKCLEERLNDNTEVWPSFNLKGKVTAWWYFGLLRKPPWLFPLLTELMDAGGPNRVSMGYGYYASWDFCWVWKPQWLHPIHLQTSCFPMPVVSCARSMECMFSLVCKPLWPLLKFLDCIMMILMSTGCAATFGPAKIFPRAPITMNDLPPVLVIINEDPTCQVLTSVQLSQIILFSSGGIAWLVWISIMLEYSADRAIGEVGAITVTGAIVRPQPWPSFIMVDMGSATWCFNWSVKHPWPPPNDKTFSYVLAPVFVIAGICSRTPITVHELLPWLGCDLVGEVLQRKCGGTCLFFLLEGCHVEHIHDAPGCQVLVAAQFHFSVSMVGIGPNSSHSSIRMLFLRRIFSQRGLSQCVALLLDALFSYFIAELLDCGTVGRLLRLLTALEYMFEPYYFTLCHAAITKLTPLIWIVGTTLKIWCISDMFSFIEHISISVQQKCVGISGIIYAGDVLMLRDYWDCNKRDWRGSNACLFSWSVGEELVQSNGDEFSWSEFNGDENILSDWNTHGGLQQLTLGVCGGFSPWSKVGDKTLWLVLFAGTYLMDVWCKRPNIVFRQWDPGILGHDCWLQLSTCVDIMNEQKAQLVVEFVDVEVLTHVGSLPLFLKQQHHKSLINISEPVAIAESISALEKWSELYSAHEFSIQLCRSQCCLGTSNILAGR